MSSKQEEDVDLPPPPDDPAPGRKSGYRLWIGNLDSRITEFSLLKLLQKQGDLCRYDFVYHKSGPDQGKSRGYCFATYSTLGGAEKAMKSLDGKLALSKRLVVRAAKMQRRDNDPKLTILSGNSTSTKMDDADKEARIRAIESKLKIMENSSVGPVVPGSSKQNPATSGSSHTGQSRWGRHDQKSHRQDPKQHHTSPGYQGRSQSHRRSHPYTRDGHR